MRQYGVRVLAAAFILGLLSGCASGGGQGETSASGSDGNVVTDTAGDIAGG
ncbi:MAG: hypothetical protein FWG17_06805 [Desulfovibrionaceae bacterium]|nr:hypothetical protein [Desulfovibrionaceae bacterium]